MSNVPPKARLAKGGKCQMCLRKAQSLLEVVVAVAIATILAVSIISTTLITQRTAKSAENKTRATKLAQEGIEQIRIFRDRKGFDELLNNRPCTHLGSVVNPDPNDWTLSTCLIAPIQGEEIKLGDTFFYRKMSIENDPAVPDPTDPIHLRRKLITVTIGWEEPRGVQELVNSTYLSKWD